MSLPFTHIRRMWQHGDGHSGNTKTVLILPEGLDGRTFGKAKPVLVIPDNPAARAAMVERVRAAYRADPKAPLLPHGAIEYVLATALTP